jgi:hypothetical protein
MTAALARSEAYEANLLRLSGMPPMTIEGNTVRNAFEVHLVNKRAERTTFTLAGEPRAHLRYTVAIPRLTLTALQSQRVPVFVSFERGTVHDGERAQIRVQIEGEPPRALDAPLIAPGTR